MGAWFALNVPLVQMSFWMHPIKLLGDTGHVESRFGLFGDCVSIGARWVFGLRQTYHQLRNCFGCTRWYS
jgi:hypothetical protein